MITYYKSWLEKAGTTQKVQRLEFVGFVKNDKEKPKVFYDNKKNSYLCGLYRCTLPDGLNKILKFRCEHDPSDRGNDVGWNYNRIQDVQQDTKPDQITCSRQVYDSGKVDSSYESNELQEVAKRHYNMIMKLENFLKIPTLADLYDSIKLKLNYVISPDRESSRCFQEYKSIYPEKIFHLNALLDSE